MVHDPDVSPVVQNDRETTANGSQEVSHGVDKTGGRKEAVDRTEHDEYEDDDGAAMRSDGTTAST